MSDHDAILVDHSSVDLSVDLAPWSDLIPATASIIAVDRLANVYLRRPDKGVLMLDVHFGVVEELAQLESDFEREFAGSDLGLHIRGLLRDSVAYDVKPKTGEVLVFTPPVALGGDLTASTAMAMKLKTALHLLGHIFLKTREMPPGSRIDHLTVNGRRP
ncbi:MAG: hypothetical protein AAGE18_00070 [Pseudomonadota bacterium]